MIPATADTSFDALVADLTGGGIVTRVLERWSGGRVHAERVACDVPASAATRALLATGAGETVRHRRVRLMRGGLLLSEADNWLLPDRLTSGMRSALESTDTPFGMVIAPLDPRRETLACERLAGDPMLLIRALVRSGDGAPLALVEERYRQAIFG